MANFKAADVKKLRDATGAGMMDAKKALTEADGDFDKAIEVLRVSGQAKAAKRADRDASNGLVASAGGALIQLGAETDFVAKNAEFMELADEVAKAVDAARATDVAAANAAPLGDATVADKIHELAVKIGEKLELADAAWVDGAPTIYLHRRAADLPPQVGVLIDGSGDEAVLKSVAMHIAAMSPQYLTRDEVPADVVEQERRVAEDKAREEGKPEQALPKIVEGRVNAYYRDVVLLDQMSVSEDKKTVAQVLTEAGVEIRGFKRFEAGEA